MALTDYEWEVINKAVAMTDKQIARLQREMDNLDTHYTIRGLQDDIYRLQEEVRTLQSEVADLQRGH